MGSFDTLNKCKRWFSSCLPLGLGRLLRSCCRQKVWSWSWGWLSLDSCPFFLNHDQIACSLWSVLYKDKPCCELQFSMNESMKVAVIILSWKPRRMMVVFPTVLSSCSNPLISSCVDSRKSSRTEESMRHRLKWSLGWRGLLRLTSPVFESRKMMVCKVSGWGNEYQQ